MCVLLPVQDDQVLLSHDDFELESYDCPNLQGSFKRQKNGRWSASQPDCSPTSDISNQTKPPHVEESETESEARKEKAENEADKSNGQSAVKSPKKTDENQSSDHGLLTKRVTIQLVTIPGGARAVRAVVHGIRGVDLTPKQRANVNEQIRRFIKAQGEAKIAGTVPPTKIQMHLYD